MNHFVKQAKNGIKPGQIKIIFVSPYPKNFIAIFHTRLFFFVIVNYREAKFHVLEGYIESLSDNSFNDSLLGKYYFCNQVLAILEELKTNFNLYKT